MDSRATWAGTRFAIPIGRLTEEALEAIFSKEGVCVDLSLVRRMVDFGLLQACVDKNSLTVLD